MSKPRDTSTDTSTLTTDTSTSTEQVVPTTETQPISDSFTRTAVTDSSVSDPVIINR